jgi:hypothetical protein
VNPERRSRLALAWIWLIAAWVLAGAVFKLFWGTPALLPKVIRELPLELGLTYNLAIGIELAIAGVALTKPRWGWWMQAALLVVFDFVLTTQIAAGETNCGCFGSKLSVDPRIMLALDSVLLAGLLALRPWSCLGPGLPALAPIALATLAALAMTLPWIFDRQVDRGGVVANGKKVEGEWIELDVESWVGKDIWDTPLGRPPLNQYIDVSQLPLDGLWVFWRATCDHCAKHLAFLAEKERGQRDITLIQLEEKNDTLANRVVHSLPDGNFVKQARLPPSISYVIQTPAELVLEAGKIVSAQEAVDTEK